MISSFTTEIERKITYDDGTVQELEAGDFGFEKSNFKHATLETVEMIAIEQSEDINEMKLTAYEFLDYDGTVRNIMEYKINLNTEKISAKDKNVLIYDPENSVITDEYKIYYKKIYGVDYAEEGIYTDEINDDIEVVYSEIEAFIKILYEEYK